MLTYQVRKPSPPASSAALISTSGHHGGARPAALRFAAVPPLREQVDAHDQDHDRVGLPAGDEAEAGELQQVGVAREVDRAVLAEHVEQHALEGEQPGQ